MSVPTATRNSVIPVTVIPVIPDETAEEIIAAVQA